MMKLMRALSKTEQVVNFLKEEIKLERLLPGTKLESSRVLAAQFESSKKVVESAFSILEKEGVVSKHARNGVFINKYSEFLHLKEVYVLGVGITKDDLFFNQMLKMTYPPLLKDNFSFITRTYSTKTTLEKVIEFEINRINKMKEIDCVLINAAPLKRKHILKCSQINKPVIFLGDFKSRGIQGLKYNQVAGDNGYIAEQQVQYLYDNKCESLTLFSGSLKHFFNNEFYQGVVKKTKKLGLKFNIIEFPKGMSDLHHSLQQKEYEEIINQFLQKNQIYQGCIIQVIGRKLIQNTLLSNKKVSFQKIFFAPFGEIDYSQLCKVIINRIDELLLDPYDRKKIRIKLPLKLI